MKSAFKVFEHYDHNYEPKFDKKYDQISAEVNFLQ